MGGYRWSGGGGWGNGGGGRGGGGRRGSVRTSLWQTLVLGLARRLAGCSTYRDVMNRYTVRGDVVDLTWRGNVD